MTPPHVTPPRSYRPGRWLLLGAALGAFIGLLLGKFAIGLIVGFFAGIVIDSAKRRSASGSGPDDADHQGRA